MENQNSYYLDLVNRYPEDIKAGYNASFRNVVSDLKKPRIVFLCGVSFDFVTCSMLKNYLRSELIFLVNDYELPDFAGKDDLAIIISYTGKHEEARSLARSARRKQCQVVFLTSSKDDDVEAKIVRLAGEKNSRHSVLLCFFSVLKLLEDLDFIVPRNSDVQEVLDYVRVTDLRVTSQSLADKLFGKIPLFFISPFYREVGFVWKQYINRNAKAFLHLVDVPDAGHNEIEGLKNKNGIYFAALLYCQDDSSRIKKKMSLVKEQLNTRSIDSLEINIKNTGLIRVISNFLLAELTSYYLALRYKEDPLSEGVIVGFNEKLGPFI